VFEYKQLIVDGPMFVSDWIATDDLVRVMLNRFGPEWGNSRWDVEIGLPR
jgi:hypothetical protein